MAASRRATAAARGHTGQASSPGQVMVRTLPRVMVTISAWSPIPTRSSARAHSWSTMTTLRYCRRVHQLRAVGSDDPQQRHGLKQRDLWIDDIESFCRRLQCTAGSTSVGVWLARHCVAHMVAHRLLRMGQESGVLLHGCPLRESRMFGLIVPAQHPHGRFLHTFTRDVITAPRGGNDQAIG